MADQKLSLKIALLGCGNMGSALAKGWAAAVLSEPSLITAYDVDLIKAETLSDACGVAVSKTLSGALREAELIVVAVKPDVVPLLLAEIRTEVDDSCQATLLSIAAGVEIETIRTALGRDSISLARAMPNVACTVGAAMSAVYAVSNDLLATILPLFSGIGQCLVVNKEADLHIATGLAGSGPAYVFTMIDAMADGAVKMGLSREQALLMSAQTVFGAAKMVLDSGMHPIALRDTVISPGGTTITGLHVLEKNAFRGTLISAVEAATRKARGENTNGE